MQLLSSDPFWVLVREGIYQSAEQLHVTLVPVEVDLWQLTGDKQMEVIEEVLACSQPWWQQAVFYQIYLRSFTEPPRGDPDFEFSGLTVAPFAIIIAEIAQGM
jgi:hypothetical protein